MSGSETTVNTQIQPAIKPLDDWGRLWNFMLDERQELCAAIIRQSASPAIPNDTAHADLRGLSGPQSASSFDKCMLFDQLANVDEHLDRLFEASRCLEFHTV